MNITTIGGRLPRVPYASFFFLLVVFLLAQPFYFSSNPDLGGSSTFDRGQSITAGSVERQAGLSLLAIFALLRLRLHKPSHSYARACLCWPILLFLSWACMSTSWSDDPTLTVRRVGVLLILCMGAMAAGRDFSHRDLLLFTAGCGIATVLGGLSCELALGTFHPLDAEYRFAGLMHPNFTGWNCSLCLIAIVALARSRPRLARQGYTFLFLGVAGCMLLTKSRGALAGASLGLLTYLLLASSRRRIAAVVCITAMIAGAIVCVAILLPQNIAGPSTGARITSALLLGRTESPGTLTGRTPFWEGELLPAFLKRPVGGYGYDSFWSAGRFAQHATDQGWFFPDSHNSLIELALGLGAVGLALYLTVFAVALYLSVCASSSSPTCTGPFTAAVLVCSFVNSNLSSIQLRQYLGSFVLLTVLAQLAYRERPANLVVVPLRRRFSRVRLSAVM